MRRVKLNKKQMKAVGCLVGGAAGDALGFAVEFYEDEKIFQKYGENGIQNYDLINGVAQISDDTQMTLFTAEGLLASKSDAELLESIRTSYLNWYKTQISLKPIANQGLLSIPEMYHTRAPGNTCLSVLESGMCGTIEQPINRSKGCGGIMRVAPIAVYCYNKKIPIAQSALLAAKAAAITHGHELGYIPASFFVYILYRILEGVELFDALTDSLRSVPCLFANGAHITEVITLLKKAMDLSKQDLDDLDAIRMLGQGWVAEETLAIAVYCCLKHQNSFEQAIIAAVNHGGDSDSTGAVTGNIIGTYLGAKSIPRKYLSTLELLETIEALAIQLCGDLLPE